MDRDRHHGQYTTLQEMEAITANQPFDLKGIDSDNGGEFWDQHLYRWAIPIPCLANKASDPAGRRRSRLAIGVSSA
ncbi:hypothetical protein N9B14_05675 [Akkermansiaceae bacterium]|nr:hypothetical protein [Akkermansiaceae bacterium]